MYLTKIENMLEFVIKPSQKYGTIKLRIEEFL